MNVVGTAVHREWTAVVHPATAVTAPLGLATGVLTGLHPARRAGRIQVGGGAAPLTRPRA
ncbi:hypothetical protein [Streptomyces sp. FXY-T5]|uniref:hypothetical protein n=1 Tax=Streptomyces sp. FXY-T5 TaxID=3064901 RepID=UPI0027D1FA03|nr:hypothetical protein [Streptomyces sp. FXY-T5]WMD09146.1 hypothetical protein Q7C01_34380 [Streptomyces sp. FXY-T5]